MIRLMACLLFTLVTAVNVDENKLPQAFLEGAAVVEGENFRCTITVVTYVQEVKDGKRSTVA